MTTIGRIDPLDPADEATFAGWVQVYASAQRDTWGEAASVWSAGELRAFYEDTSCRRTAWAAVEPDGAVRGAAELIETLRDNHTSATIRLAVAPGHRRRGLGGLLLEAAETLARHNGRTVFFAETEWPEGTCDTGERFALAHGYRPALTDVRRSLSLPREREPLLRWRDSAGRAPRDYAVDVAWDDIPEHWLADRALLQGRMSTDIPLDGLLWEEEDWDPQRLREMVEIRKAQGRRFVEAVARHLPTGRLVAYTTVNLSAAEPDVAYQGDTLVMREHRGHKLGLRLKAAVALELMDHAPQVRHWRTWNAQSNAPMIAVNEELGHVVDGYLREWQKVLPR